MGAILAANCQGFSKSPSSQLEPQHWDTWWHLLSASEDPAWKVSCHKTWATFWYTLCVGMHMWVRVTIYMYIPFISTYLRQTAGKKSCLLRMSRRILMVRFESWGQEWTSMYAYVPWPWTIAAVIWVLEEREVIYWSDYYYIHMNLHVLNCCTYTYHYKPKMQNSYTNLNLQRFEPHFLSRTRWGRFVFDWSMPSMMTDIPSSPFVLDHGGA